MSEKIANPELNLQVYMVGGAVRDKLIGIKTKDRDWVVVGATPDKMIDLGFKPVGKDFPVFLHPQTGEEYALARTERKVAKGYHGFEFHSSSDISLEQDLERRDLTINSMAMDEQGNLIDPYGGKQDIEGKIIRHVSTAFREDPVRILRVARFAARFDPLGFQISEATQEYMKEIVLAGEVNTLVAERVWQEMHGALNEPRFSQFIAVLKNCGALRIILPEVDALFGIPQTEKFHPEIDTGIHIQMSLDAINRITTDPMMVFAVMTHDLGKALTPKSELPSHRGHERRGLKPIKQMCERLGVPGAYRKFALKVCEFHLHCYRVKEMRPSTILKLFESLDGFRNPELATKFTTCCLADKRGRTGHENDDDDEMRRLKELLVAAQSVDSGNLAMQVKQDVSDSNEIGSRIKRAVRKSRTEAIASAKSMQAS